MLSMVGRCIGYEDFIFVLQALVAKLREGSALSANSGIVAGVLVTVGDLARVVSSLSDSSHLPFDLCGEKTFVF